MKRVALVLLGLLIAISTANAKTYTKIVLNNGSVIEGVLIEENNQIVRLEFANRDIRLFYKSDIASLSTFEVITPEEQLVAEHTAAAKAKEAKAKARVEEQAKIAAQKEAEAKAIAEERAKIAAQKAQIAKKKRSEKIDYYLERNIRGLQYLKLEQPTDSYTNMGKEYFFGKNGKEFNIAKAFLCYNLGAKQGEGEAFLHIALYYETGKSYERFYLEKDIDTALAFYEKAESLNVQGASERINAILQNR